MSDHGGLHDSFFEYSLTQVNLQAQVVPEKSLCETHGVPLPAFKSIVKALDKDCDALADKIKSQLHNGNSPGASSKLRIRPSASPQKSPSKSVLKSKAQDRTPAKPLALKRAVAFSHDVQDDSDDISLPETPSKRRRVESPSKHSPSTPRAKHAMTPLGTTSVTTAFEQAMRGVSTPRHEAKKSAFSINSSHTSLPGPSTPQRSRTHSSKFADEANAMEVDEEPMESVELPVRKRFRPVFLDQQQWHSQDPKLAKIWDAAIEHRTKMMGLYPHPFERYRPAVTS